MKELKFRAWDVNPETQQGRFVYIDLLNFTEEAAWVLNTLDGDLQQYTGLKDKNGVEIYEGDIVKTGEGSVASVEFGYKELFFGFISTEDDEINDYHKVCGFRIGDQALAYPDDCEVIGNIYENPELLR